MRRWIISAALLLAPLSPAWAQATPATRDIMASLYVAQYLKGTLTELPLEFVRGELQFRSATLFQLDLGYASPGFDVPLPFCEGCALRGNRLELHVALGQYAGRQTNAEIGAYAMLRTGQFGEPTGMQANIAVGWGISHAFATTGMEFGRGGVQGVDTYRTQLQVPIEVEWWHPALGQWSVIVPRIHHRSGAWGLLAPYGSGSNFIGVGLRASW